jgi:hypothetical protein
MVNRYISVEYFCQFLNKLHMYATCYFMILCGVSNLVCVWIFLLHCSTERHTAAGQIAMPWHCVCVCVCVFVIQMSLDWGFANGP